MTKIEKEIKITQLVKMAEVIGGIVGDHTACMSKENTAWEHDGPDEMYAKWCLEDARTVLEGFQEMTDLCIGEDEAASLTPYLELSLRSGFIKAAWTRSQNESYVH